MASKIQQSPKIAFGVEQLKQETPRQVQAIYHVVMFASGYWAVVLEPRVPGLTDHLKAAIDNWMIIANLTIYFVCQFFGRRESETSPQPYPKEREMA